MRALTREITNLIQEPLDGVVVSFREENLTEVYAELTGPAQTPYEGGLFRMRLNIDANYPQAPPKGYFETKIFHPNVAAAGDIGVAGMGWAPQGAFGEPGDSAAGDGWESGGVVRREPTRGAGGYPRGPGRGRTTTGLGLEDGPEEASGASASSRRDRHRYTRLNPIQNHTFYPRLLNRAIYDHTEETRVKKKAFPGIRLRIRKFTESFLRIADFVHPSV